MWDLKLLDNRPQLHDLSPNLQSQSRKKINISNKYLRVKSVLFVPRSNSLKLCKESNGLQLRRIMCVKNQFGNPFCGRKNCMVCKEEDKGDCCRRNICYQTSCDNQAIKAWSLLQEQWSLMRIFIEINMRLAWHQVVLLEVFIQSSIERVLISPCTKVLAVSGMSSPSQNLVSSGPDNCFLFLLFCSLSYF